VNRQRLLRWLSGTPQGAWGPFYGGATAARAVLHPEGPRAHGRFRAGPPGQAVPRPPPAAPHTARGARLGDHLPASNRTLLPQQTSPGHRALPQRQFRTPPSQKTGALHLRRLRWGWHGRQEPAPLRPSSRQRPRPPPLKRARRGRAGERKGAAVRLASKMAPGVRGLKSLVWQSECGVPLRVPFPPPPRTGSGLGPLGGRRLGPAGSVRR